MTVVPLPSWATSRSGRPVGESSLLTKASPSGEMAPALVFGVIGYFVASYLSDQGVNLGMRPAVFGFLIGVLTWVIRVINPAFPEGIMLAILLGNIFAPLIDYFVIRANVRRRVKRNA